MLVFGTRPEAIKMLPVLAELRRRGLARGGGVEAIRRPGMF